MCAPVSRPEERLFAGARSALRPPVEVLPVPPRPAKAEPNRPAPPLEPTVIELAWIAPPDPREPRTTTVSPGWIESTLVVTVFVTLEPGAALTLTVLPSLFFTYKVPLRTYATSPVVTPAPARAPAAPLLEPGTAPRVPPRSSRKRLAADPDPVGRPPLEERAEAPPVLVVWCFSTSTPAMKPQATRRMLSRASGTGARRRRRGLPGSSPAVSASHASGSVGPRLPSAAWADVRALA